MSFPDRVLAFTATICVFSISLLFASQEPAPAKAAELRNIAPNPEKESPADDIASILGTIPETDNNGLVVLQEEADTILEAYFRRMQENPESDEEARRMLDGNSGEDDGFLDSTPVKKAATAGREEVRKSSAVPASGLFVDHLVRKGESVWRLSQMYNVPVYTIISANKSKEHKPVVPGETLRIPTKAGVVHKKDKKTSLAEIAKLYKTSPSSVVSSDPGLLKGQEVFIPGARPVPTVQTVSKKRFIWPLNGKLTSRYGIRRHPIRGDKHFHTGIDIGAPYGARINAVADGMVIFAGDGGSYGNMIVLRHNDGYYSVYGHCSSLLVDEGSYVKRGQKIARVGHTGSATGPHLHFEIKQGEKLINPLVAFQSRVKTAVR